MLAPLMLRGVDFKSGLVQGPLAGYSCAPFRRLIWQHSQPAFCYTEMLPAKQICIEHGAFNRHTWRHPDEVKLCYQLSGCDPKALAEATAIVVGMGADCIDLNVGCPKPKIRKKRHGSALLAYPELLYECLSAMRSATQLPLLAKIRIDGGSNERHNLLVAQAVMSAGVDALVIHARNWREDYSVPCSWDQIALFKASCRGIPLILNGDISGPHSLHALLQKTGCAHAMVARGSMGRPDWIHYLSGSLEGELGALGLEQSVLWLKQHLEDLSQLESCETTRLQARSIVSYYAKHLSAESAHHLVQIVRGSSDFKSLILKFNKILQNIE